MVLLTCACGAENVIDHAYSMHSLSIEVAVNFHACIQFELQK